MRSEIGKGKTVRLCVLDFGNDLAYSSNLSDWPWWFSAGEDYADSGEKMAITVKINPKVTRHEAIRFLLDLAKTLHDDDLFFREIDPNEITKSAPPEQAESGFAGMVF